MTTTGAPRVGPALTGLTSMDYSELSVRVKVGKVITGGLYSHFSQQVEYVDIETQLLHGIAVVAQKFLKNFFFFRLKVLIIYL